METQNKVAQATRDRGYRDGWDTYIFIARNIAKLQEELAEASDCVLMPYIPWIHIAMAGDSARNTFDDPKCWNYMHDDTPIQIEQLKSELADIAVVLCNLADAVGELDGKPFDMMQAAREKALADVDRGVR